MDSSLTDRYVRNKLSPAEIEEYELRMLDSPELQRELEEGLILQQALKLDKTETDILQESGVTEAENGPYLMQWALAASIALMLVSSYLYVSTWSVTNILKNQVAILNKPRSEVHFSTVKIMRFASNSIPASTIQLPEQNSTVILEIELGARSRDTQLLLFRLESDNNPEHLSWVGSPDADGLTTVSINSEQLPLGLVFLVVSASDGEVLERRLLEFRESEKN